VTRPQDVIDSMTGGTELEKLETSLMLFVVLFLARADWLPLFDLVWKPPFGLNYKMFFCFG